MRHTLIRRPGRRIADALRKRGVRKLAYFHTDHFEPWRHVPGRPADMRLSARDVEDYARTIEGLDFARRPSIFLKSNVNFAVDDERPLHRAVPEDRLGFVERTEADWALGRAIMAPLAAGAGEIQLHIHHENFTWNGSLNDPTTRDYLATPAGKALGPARLELAIRLNLELIRQDGGPMLDRWFFIHGHWAINASDPDECTIVREIELLMRNGCLGDFSQPSGRPHVDGRVGEPCLVRPVAAAKGYDTPAADPLCAFGAGAHANRFFLWSTKLDHRFASIDSYSNSVIRRARQPEAFGLAQAERGVLLGDTLYVKTHGHSMAPQYWEGDAAARFPHADPRVQAELRALFDAADAAGADISFVTASEAYDAIVGAAAPSAPAHGHEGLVRGSPMDILGVTVVHRDTEGRVVAPPPLPFRAPRLAPPAPLMIDPGISWGTLPAIVGLAEMGDASMRGAIDIQGDHAATINAVASRVVLDRLRGDAAQREHLTGFYPTRAEERSLLQPNEEALAAWTLARFGTSPTYWEIGCGIGLLSLLLTAQGAHAVGVERYAGRIATAHAIASAAATEGLPSRIDPEWITGAFPKVIRKRHGLAGGIALVTNLLGAADEAAQRRFIVGLRRFGAVIVDAQRFFTRRNEPSQWDELASFFQDAGFPPPEFALASGDARYLLFGPARLGIGDLAIRLDRWRARSPFSGSGSSRDPAGR